MFLSLYFGNEKSKSRLLFISVEIHSLVTLCERQGRDELPGHSEMHSIVNTGHVRWKLTGGTDSGDFRSLGTKRIPSKEERVLHCFRG